ncbi:hypothetical protein AA0120_g10597 [Alternaria tenuissima]|nr:hypothetical protein AA0120_g10597 [Alternaria tenuissima]
MTATKSLTMRILHEKDIPKSGTGTEANSKGENENIASSLGQLGKSYGSKSLSVLDALSGFEATKEGLRADRQPNPSTEKAQLDDTVSIEEAIEIPQPFDKYGEQDLKESAHSHTETSLTLSNPSNAVADHKSRVSCDTQLEHMQSEVLKIGWIAYNDQVLMLFVTAALFSLEFSLYGVQGYSWGRVVVALPSTVIMVAVGLATLRRYRTQQLFADRKEAEESFLASALRSGKRHPMFTKGSLVGNVIHLELGDIICAGATRVQGHEILHKESEATDKLGLPHRQYDFSSPQRYGMRTLKCFIAIIISSLRWVCSCPWLHHALQDSLRSSSASGGFRSFRFVLIAATLSPIVAAQSPNADLHPTWKQRSLSILEEILVLCTTLVAPVIILAICFLIAKWFRHSKKEKSASLGMLCIAAVLQSIRTRSDGDGTNSAAFVHMATGFGYIMFMVAYCELVMLRNGGGKLFCFVASAISVLATLVLMAFAPTRTYWLDRTKTDPFFALSIAIPISFYLCDLTIHITKRLDEYERRGNDSVANIPPGNNMPQGWRTGGLPYFDMAGLRSRSIFNGSYDSDPCEVELGYLESGQPPPASIEPAIIGNLLASAKRLFRKVD